MHTDPQRLGRQTLQADRIPNPFNGYFLHLVVPIACLRSDLAHLHAKPEITMRLKPYQIQWTYQSIPTTSKGVLDVVLMQLRNAHHL